MTRIHVPIHLRWADLDAYNHVNNVEVVRLLEEARVRAFWLTEPGGGDADPGLALIDAVTEARAYVAAALRAAPGLGHGHGPLGLMHPYWK